MNKETSKISKKHEFVSNLGDTLPLSVDHFDFVRTHQLSKDSLLNEEGELFSTHQDYLATATDYLPDKNLQTQPDFPHRKRSQSKKRSIDNPTDVITHLLSAPSSTKNAKIVNKPSQSRTISRSNTAHHLNFLNSKEFAKFALSKVLPKDAKKEKGLHREVSPPQKKSPASSLEKRSPKKLGKADPVANSKSQAGLTKKQKVKPRASNLTYNDFSSLMSQTQTGQSFMNSPPTKGSPYASIPVASSTSNLRSPLAIKNSNQTQKSAWQHAANDAFKRVQASTRRNQQQVLSPQEGSRSKERNKGVKSIASTLNLRRSKKNSPEKDINSCYPAAPNFHRKVVSSIGCEAQNTFNNSHQASQLTTTHMSHMSHTLSPQGDHKSSIQKSPPKRKKTSNSPSKKENIDVKKIERIPLSVKDSNLYEYSRLQETFDSLLEKYRGDMQNTQENYSMLKQAKQAYEKLISELLMQLKDKTTVSKPTVQQVQQKELELKCDSLSKENTRLTEELKYIKLENQKLHSMVSDMREEHIGPLNNKSQDYIIENTAENSQVVNDSHLKKILESQQNLIDLLQNKEKKLMQLLYTIHRQGFDVEKLLREEAEKDSGYSDSQLRHSTENNEPKIYSVHSANKESERSGEIEMCSLITSQDISGISEVITDYQMLKEKYAAADAKTSDTSPYLAGNSLGSPLKTQLKLDLRGLLH